MAGGTSNHHLGDLTLEALEVFVCIVKNSMKGESRKSNSSSVVSSSFKVSTLMSST